MEANDGSATTASNEGPSVRAQRSRRLRPIAGLAALALAMCVAGVAGAIGRAANPPETPRPSLKLLASADVGVGLKPGHVAIFGVVTLESTRRITLLGATPLGLPDDVEVRAARMNFVSVSPTGPGVTCTRAWPPTEFTLTQSLAGTTVDPADVRTGGPFMLTFYLTKSREGASRMIGFRVRYEDERGHVLEQTFDHPTFKLTMHDKDREFRHGPCLGFPRDGTAP